MEVHGGSGFIRIKSRWLLDREQRARMVALARPLGAGHRGSWTRVFIDQTGGTGVSLQGPDGVYRSPLWALVGVLWHELHYLATTQIHVERSYPYGGAWKEAMDGIKAGLPPTIWDPISMRMVSLNTQGWRVEDFRYNCAKFA